MGRKKRNKKTPTVNHNPKISQATLPTNKGQTVSNTTTNIFRQVKEIPGFMTAVLEHNVATTNGRMTFSIKMGANVWHEILAFFKWSYDTTKSETQVRLYVSPTQGIWKAWAFPQKANTGMTAQELDTHERFAPQRAQFPEPEWVYFGTVHHHCSATAFQSGTDEANEKGIDGLHITVGNMDKPVYDFHSRLYLGGVKFIPDMSWFWDVGDYKAQVPVLPWWAEVKVPDENSMAVLQMRQRAPDGTEFPQEWKDNIIYPPPAPAIVRTEYMGGLGYGGMGNNGPTVEYRRPYCDRSQPVTDWDLRKCNRMFNAYNDSLSKDMKMSEDELVARLLRIENGLDDIDLEIVDIMCRCDTLPGDFAIYIQTLREELDKKAEKPKDKEAKVEEKLLNDDVCGECGLKYPYHGRTCTHAGPDEQDLAFQS